VNSRTCVVTRWLLLRVLDLMVVETAFDPETRQRLLHYVRVTMGYTNMIVPRSP
jgi:hypothetical protein